MAVWLWNFWIFSFWGWCLERLFAAVTHSPRHRRRWVLALPAPLLSGWRLYFFGSLAATAVEYLYHWWGDCFLRVRFWDYTSVPGNLRGRVCLPFSLAWGLLMFPAVKLAAPAAAALALRVPPLLTWLCLMVFTADVVCSLRFLAVTHDLNALRRAI